MTDMCPHCGEKMVCDGLTPVHDWPKHTRQGCPGSQQNPRCAESDGRLLWNGNPNPHFHRNQPAAGPAALADWYRRKFPEGPDHDERCLRVLRVLAPFYRLPIVDDEIIPEPDIGAEPPPWLYEDEGGVKREPRLDGGIERCGDGLAVTLRGGYTLDTFDGDELTQLVIAAHRWHCRVSIGTAVAYDPDVGYDRPVGVKLMIHPRKDPADGPTEWPLYDTHPGLAELLDQIGPADA